MKKNLRKVPHQVLDRLNTIELDDIVVACAKRLKIQDIGRYAHLGLAYENGRLVLPPPVCRMQKPVNTLPPTLKERMLSVATYQWFKRVILGTLGHS